MGLKRWGVGFLQGRPQPSTAGCWEKKLRNREWSGLGEGESQGLHGLLKATQFEPSLHCLSLSKCLQQLELGTQPRSCMGVGRDPLLEMLSLAPRTYASRKLESGVGARLDSRHPTCERKASEPFKHLALPHF